MNAYRPCHTDVGLSQAGERATLQLGVPLLRVIAVDRLVGQTGLQLSVGEDRGL